jgi:hypothetical protein
MGLELRKYCIVGGNAVSAFLSWRLQATNACDVTLVWKANFQSVAQYGISFKYVHARQVSNFGWVRQKLTNYRTGHSGLETSGSYLAMVNKSLQSIGAHSDQGYSRPES